MNKLSKILLLAVFSLLNAITYAQSMNKNAEDPSDFMRSDGKIYVVVAVVVTIVAGIFIYLVNLDRKIKKLEDK